MSKQDIQKRLTQALLQSPYRGSIRRISLFGSQLRGTAKEGSDIDLLVEFNKPIGMFTYVHLEQDLSDALGKKVELSTPQSLSKYFRADVLNEAELIFEAA